MADRPALNPRYDGFAAAAKVLGLGLGERVGAR
jgi:hypothetical protein